MPRLRTRSTRRASGVRPRYLWEPVVTTVATITTNQNAVTDLMPTDPALLTPALTPNRGLTLERVVGKVSITPATLTGLQDMDWVQAIGLVTDVAFAAAAIPLPQVDSPGWSWWESARREIDGSAAHDFSHHVPVDTPARRRIAGSGMTLFHIIRNLGAASLEVQLNLRILYRLP